MRRERRRLRVGDGDMPSLYFHSAALPGVTDDGWRRCLQKRRFN
jgi:hypothetical protein